MPVGGPWTMQGFSTRLASWWILSLLSWRIGLLGFLTCLVSGCFPCTAAPTRQMCHVTMRMMSLGCRPPGTRISENQVIRSTLFSFPFFFFFFFFFFHLLAHPGRWESLYGGPSAESDRGPLGTGLPKRSSWWLVGTGFCTKTIGVTPPQIFCMGKSVWLCV